MSDKATATNRQAHQLYHIYETMEAGLVLTGTEVKSLRQGKCQLKDSYCLFMKGELYAHNIHIAIYEQGNVYNHEPTRPRKLLMHKREMMRVYGQLSEKGLTLIPLKIYSKHGLFKCLIGLAKTKKMHDRRDDIKKKMAKKEIDRAIKSRTQN
jgi:SsrA-binding protein